MTDHEAKVLEYLKEAERLLSTFQTMNDFELRWLTRIISSFEYNIHSVPPSD